MEQFPILKDTPIKEIILGISYDGIVDLEVFDKISDIECIQNNFKTVIPTEQTSISLNRDLNKAETTIKREGTIFKNSNGKTLQFKIGSVSLHLVDKYESLEELINELQLYWNSFIEKAGGLSIVNISVRYLNFFPITENEEISDYLKIYPSHPFGSVKVSGFCTIKFELDETFVTVASTKGKILDSEGVILDYTLKKDINKGKSQFFDDFKKMRETKNKVFFTSITEKTLNIYKS
jgi:uncharacterized protein (TIGR04255 family)